MCNCIQKPIHQVWLVMRHGQCVWSWSSSVDCRAAKILFSNEKRVELQISSTRLANRCVPSPAPVPDYNILSSVVIARWSTFRLFQESGGLRFFDARSDTTVRQPFLFYPPPFFTPAPSTRVYIDVLKYDRVLLRS